MGANFSTTFQSLSFSVMLNICIANFENFWAFFENSSRETKKINSHICKISLTLFRMGFFGAAHGLGRGGAKGPLPKICHTYPTMVKLGTIIPYLKDTQKMYESRDTPLEFC